MKNIHLVQPEMSESREYRWQTKSNTACRTLRVSTWIVLMLQRFSLFDVPTPTASRILSSCTSSLYLQTTNQWLSPHSSYSRLRSSILVLNLCKHDISCINRWSTHVDKWTVWSTTPMSDAFDSKASRLQDLTILILHRVSRETLNFKKTGVVSGTHHIRCAH